MASSMNVCRKLRLCSMLGRIIIRNSCVTPVKLMCSDQSNKSSRPPLKLAKPGKTKSVSPTTNQQTSNDSMGKVESEMSSESIGSEMAKAVDSVADSLGGNKGQQIRSDLLKKLQQHAEMNEELQQMDTTNVSVLLSGMKVESLSKVRRQELNRTIEAENGGIGGQRSSRRRGTGSRHDDFNTRGSDSYGTAASRAAQQDLGSLPDLRLFEGPPVGIFKKMEKDLSSSLDEQPAQKSLFNILEREEIQALSSMPPQNAFEEMIQWTKEGKLWTFPIDNDQGMTEEAKVGFHEHVFLEPLLNNFPKKGPVRHFMELVAVGLSKNPYLTVEEKKSHIKWFEEYFQDKYGYFEDSHTAEHLRAPAECTS